jgi:hypothetical protein
LWFQVLGAAEMERGSRREVQSDDVELAGVLDVSDPDFDALVVEVSFEAVVLDVGLVSFAERPLAP